MDSRFVKNSELILKIKSENNLEAKIDSIEQEFLKTNSVELLGLLETILLDERSRREFIKNNKLFAKFHSLYDALITHVVETRLAIGQQLLARMHLKNPTELQELLTELEPLQRESQKIFDYNSKLLGNSEEIQKKAKKFNPEKKKRYQELKRLLDDEGVTLKFRKFTKDFNDFNNYILIDVLEKNSASARLLALRRWLLIGERCADNGDYQSLCVIQGIATNTAMKNVCDNNSPETSELLKLGEIVKRRNAIVMRKRDYMVGKVIPFLGDYAVDVEHAMQGMPNEIVIINTHKLIQEMQKQNAKKKTTTVARSDLYSINMSTKIRELLAKNNFTISNVDSMMGFFKTVILHSERIDFAKFLIRENENKDDQFLINLLSTMCYWIFQIDDDKETAIYFTIDVLKELPFETARKHLSQFLCIFSVTTPASYMQIEAKIRQACFDPQNLLAKLKEKNLSLSSPSKDLLDFYKRLEGYQQIEFVKLLIRQTKDENAEIIKLLSELKNDFQQIELVIKLVLNYKNENLIKLLSAMRSVLVETNDMIVNFTKTVLSELPREVGHANKNLFLSKSPSNLRDQINQACSDSVEDTRKDFDTVIAGISRLYKFDIVQETNFNEAKNLLETAEQKNSKTKKMSIQKQYEDCVLSLRKYGVKQESRKEVVTAIFENLKWKITLDQKIVYLNKSVDAKQVGTFQLNAKEIYLLKNLKDVLVTKRDEESEVRISPEQREALLKHWRNTPVGERKLPRIGEYLEEIKKKRDKNKGEKLVSKHPRNMPVGERKLPRMKEYLEEIKKKTDKNKGEKPVSKYVRHYRFFTNTFSRGSLPESPRVSPISTKRKLKEGRSFTMNDSDLVRNDLQNELREKREQEKSVDTVVVSRKLK